MHTKSKQLNPVGISLVILFCLSQTVAWAETETIEPEAELLYKNTVTYVVVDTP